MTDPLSLTAAGIATLILTKALEKTGEKIGEIGFKSTTTKLLELLKRKDPQTAGKIEHIAQHPNLINQSVDSGIAEIVRKVETLAQQDYEVNNAVNAVVNVAQMQPGTIQNLTKFAEKIGVLNQGVILNQQNTINL